MTVAGCASAPEPPPEYPPMEAPPAASTTGTATPPEPPGAPTATTPPAPPVQVVAGDNTPLEGAAPSVKLRTPQNGQLIKADPVQVTLDVKNWALTPDGNHIHLIVDNEPYIAVRDTSKPIDLGALVQKELGHPLSEGTHVLRAFPGRGHHESVKEGAAFDVRVFHYKTKTADFKFDPKAPLLTYSRPKGCSDAGSRVLLDFYVTNTKLSPTDSRVHYVIDSNVSGDIVAFTPHYVENLAAGEHKLQLTLQDASGNPVPGPFNDTTRTIKIAPDCKALATATTPAPAATSGTPPSNAPLVTAPTPSGPATPPTAAPSETPAPKAAAPK
ncbi:MAG TPA: hypothetical protein VJR89_15740 [Polyangiales bacterium]|nr:hypothetical protein [Polyangiales bacterium]